MTLLTGRQSNHGRNLGPWLDPIVGELEQSVMLAPISTIVAV